MEAWLIATGILGGLTVFFFYLLLAEKKHSGKEEVKNEIAEANLEALKMANKTAESINSLSSSDLRERSKRWVRKD